MNCHRWCPYHFVKHHAKENTYDHHLSDPAQVLHPRKRTSTALFNPRFPLACLHPPSFYFVVRVLFTLLFSLLWLDHPTTNPAAHNISTHNAQAYWLSKPVPCWWTPSNWNWPAKSLYFEHGVTFSHQFIPSNKQNRTMICTKLRSVKQVASAGGTSNLTIWKHFYTGIPIILLRNSTT
jgi:hypothetical protein